jgi:hypothetical protein
VPPVDGLLLLGFRELDQSKLQTSRVENGLQIFLKFSWDEVGMLRVEYCDTNRFEPRIFVFCVDSFTREKLGSSFDPSGHLR